MCTYTTHIHTCARCARQETVLISEQICPVARPSGIFGTCPTGILFQQRDAHAGPPPLSLSPRFSTTTSTSTSSPSSSYSTTAGPWTAGSGTPGSAPPGSSTPGSTGRQRQRRSTSGAYRARGYSLNQCWPCREAVRVAIAAAVAAAGEMGGGRWGGRRASGSTSSSSFGYTSSSSSGYGYSTSSGFEAGTALAAGGRGRMEGWVGGRSGSGRGDGGSGALGVRMEGGGVGVAGDWV
ncbi:hypothetical protein B0J18DRAFT_413053 [Chaetomium sp. MPI-SDFR-AT-0129]|nr:hypothetical protein B0J18DRAFT_413053 [Chaetomium sp. MPI-SDFR-AT-0129]